MIDKVMQRNEIGSKSGFSRVLPKSAVYFLIENNG